MKQVLPATSAGHDTRGDSHFYMLQPLFLAWPILISSCDRKYPFCI